MGNLLRFISRPCGVCGRTLPYEKGEAEFADALCPACIVWAIYESLKIGGIDCASVLIVTNKDLESIT